MMQLNKISFFVDFFKIDTDVNFYYEMKLMRKCTNKVKIKFKLKRNYLANSLLFQKF